MFISPASRLWLLSVPEAHSHHLHLSKSYLSPQDTSQISFQMSNHKQGKGGGGWGVEGNGWVVGGGGEGCCVVGVGCVIWGVGCGVAGGSRE